MIKSGLFGGAYDDYNDAAQRAVENAFWNSPDPDNFGPADVAQAVANPAQVAPGPMDYVQSEINQSPPPLSWSSGAPLGEVSAPEDRTYIGGLLAGEQAQDATSDANVEVAQANDNLPPKWDQYPRDPACTAASHECLEEAPPGKRSKCIEAEVGCNGIVDSAKAQPPNAVWQGRFPNGRTVIIPGGPGGTPRFHPIRRPPEWDRNDDNFW